MKTEQPIAERWTEACKEIDKDLFPIKPGESVNERFEKANALVLGYNQWHPVWRALGFNDSYGVSLHPISVSVMNKGDLENSVLWLMANGYEIIKK